MTRVLTQRELNRSLLARQLLLRRSALSVPKALEQLGGIQAQYAPSSYVRLWNCLRRFAMRDLDRLLEQRTVVQGTLMRSTIHLVSTRDYWRFAEGIGPSRQEWWRQTWGKEFSRAEMDRIAAKLDAELTGRTWPRKELDQLMRSHSTTVWSGAWVALIRVPPSGTWSRRRADLFQRAAEWIGPSDADERAGLEHLLRRFLGGFGPARLADAAGWAGVSTESMKSVAEGMTLRRFRDGKDRELVDLPRAPCRQPRRQPRFDFFLLLTRRSSAISAQPRSCPRCIGR